IRTKGGRLAYGGAFLFVDFLNRNSRLLDTTGNPVINDIGPAALALLVAESDPAHKKTMIRLIMNMLAQGARDEGILVACLEITQYYLRAHERFVINHF
ncbi:MAG: hypothetical protein Q8J61_03920, partial [Sulfuricella sp.]|nr:hypothetical protein [Sulfuricella sp.]